MLPNHSATECPPATACSECEWILIPSPEISGLCSSMCLRICTGEEVIHLLINIAGIDWCKDLSFKRTGIILINDIVGIWDTTVKMLSHVSSFSSGCYSFTKWWFSIGMSQSRSSYFQSNTDIAAWSISLTKCIRDIYLFCCKTRFLRKWTGCLDRHFSILADSIRYLFFCKYRWPIRIPDWDTSHVKRCRSLNPERADNVYITFQSSIILH